MIHFADINQAPSSYTMLQHIERVATTELVPRNCLRYLKTKLIIGGWCWSQNVCEVLQKQQKKLGVLLILPNVRQKGKYLKNMRRSGEKCDGFKIAKRMVKTNRDIIGEQRIRNNDCASVVSDEDKKIAWKSYQKKLYNTEFAWDRNSLTQAYTVIGVFCLKDNMIRELFSKMKIGKATGP